MDHYLLCTFTFILSLNLPWGSMLQAKDASLEFFSLSLLLGEVHFASAKFVAFPDFRQIGSDIFFWGGENFLISLYFCLWLLKHQGWHTGLYPSLKLQVFPNSLLLVPDSTVKFAGHLHLSDGHWYLDKALKLHEKPRSNGAISRSIQRLRPEKEGVAWNLGSSSDLQISSWSHSALPPDDRTWFKSQILQFHLVIFKKYWLGGLERYFSV